MPLFQADMALPLAEACSPMLAPPELKTFSAGPLPSLRICAAGKVLLSRTWSLRSGAFVPMPTEPELRNRDARKNHMRAVHFSALPGRERAPACATGS